MTPAGTSNELDVQNGWEENTHTHMEDTTLPKCEMFGEMVGGAGCVRGQEKELMGCFLDDLRAFGINADRWTTAAED